jgi:ribosome-associated heat shock protein Hsp15
MSDAASVRLDKWLFFARLCKTRGLARTLIERGQVALNGVTVRKAGAVARVNDRLVVVLGPVKRTVTVQGLGTRRGPAAAARLLYDEPAPPQRLTGEDRGLPPHRPLLTGPAGAGRPTKKHRRAIDKLLRQS